MTLAETGVVETPADDGWSSTLQWHLMFLIGLPALVFVNSIRNGYHLDDFSRVTSNIELEQFWPPTRFFADIRTGSVEASIVEYRPFMPLSHSFDLHLADAFGMSRLVMFHISNITIHIGSTVLLYLLLVRLTTHWDPSTASRLGKDARHAAFAAALIFGVHPISGSLVNYVVGRDQLLMTLFLFASMLVYVKMREDRDTVVGWALCLVLVSMAILSKQEAIVAFAFVLVFEVVLARASLADWKLWGRTALMAVPTAGYFLLWELWIPQQNYGDASGADYPLTMLKAHVFYYGRNIVWPFEMRALASFDLATSLADVRVIIGVVAIAATLVVAWRCFSRMPLMTFAIVSYWLFFALTSSVFPFRYIVTDYRQYVPLAFLSLALVLTLSFWSPRAVTAAALVAFVVFSSAASIHINTHWKTEESFWYQSVKYGARALAHNNYALAISDGDPMLAEFHYLEALQKEPDNIYPQINLGLLWVRQGRQAEGLTLLRTAADRNPNWALAAYWLSKGLGIAGLREEQAAAAIRAADLEPGLAYQYEAGLALQLSGDTTASIPYLEHVVDASAGYEEALFLLAFAHGNLGESDLAISEYERYLAIYPDHVQSHFNLGYALADRGGCLAAIEHFDMVLILRPEYTEAHYHLARCYRELGDETEAQRQDLLYETG